jgi:hypothetical protein
MQTICIIEALLKRFEKLGGDRDLTVADMKVRRNMQSSMARKLQGFNSSFRATQKEYGSKLDRQKSGVSVEWFDPNSKKVDSVDYDPGFTQMQQMESENMSWVSNSES